MFGVPLVTLVTCEGTDVPKIIRRVVEHVEQYGTVVLSNKTLFINFDFTLAYVHTSLIHAYNNTYCVSAELAVVLFNAGTH